MLRIATGNSFREVSIERCRLEVMYMDTRGKVQEKDLKGCFA